MWEMSMSSELLSYLSEVYCLNIHGVWKIRHVDLVFCYASYIDIMYRVLFPEYVSRR